MRVTRRPPQEYSVWDPGTGGFGVPTRRPVYESLPGAGPALVAIPFDDRWIALYPRSVDGSAGPVPLAEIPVDQEVAWVDRPARIRDAAVHQVAWSEEPILDGGALRGTIIVHTLVDGEVGAFWSPRIPVEVTGTGGARELYAEVAGGVLRADGLDMNWGTDGTHAWAVSAFLEAEQPLLWRMLHGGPGIDAAWRVGAITGPSSGYKRWAVDALVRHSEGVVPHLLAVLEGILNGVAEPDDVGPLYALSLLAHLRAPEAHAILLRLARLDRDVFEAALRGYLTEQFDAALLRTAGEDLQGIQELLLDRDVHGYLRSHAANALVAAVELERADRTEVLALLASQLDSSASSDPDSYIWSGVGSALLALHAVEFEQQLVEACESGLVERMHFDAQYVRDRLRADPEPLDSQCLDLARNDDVHRWIGWWACFQE